MHKHQENTGPSTGPSNAEKDFSQTLNNASSSTYERKEYGTTSIIINHRTTDDKNEFTLKNEWFASLGSKRLTEIYNTEEELKEAMTTLDFFFLLACAIASDVYDFKFKQNIKKFDEHLGFTKHDPQESLDQNQFNE